MKEIQVGDDSPRIEGARPILLLDVGFAATGVAVASLHGDGPHVALDVIVPTRGLSPKALREKRAATKFGDLAERLFGALLLRLTAHQQEKDGAFSFVAAEVPVMGARSAAGMRSMALALACWRAAASFNRQKLRTFEFSRNDVLAALGLAGKKADDTQKAETERRVLAACVVDDSRLPPVRMMPQRKLGKRVIPAGPCREDLELRWDAFDAAALLFAARENGVLNQAGWGDWIPGIDANHARSIVP